MEVRKKNGCLVWFVVAVVSSLGAVASASATLWLHVGASLTKAELSTSHGLLLLHHTGGLTGAYLIHCTGLFIGTVGPGALDTVTEVQGLKGEKNVLTCTFTEGGSCGTTGASETVTAIDLPWHTLLELVEGKTRDHFLEETGKEPGYELGCSKIFGFKGNCKGLDFSNFTTNGTNGAMFSFPGESKAKCSDGGEGTTLGEGESLGGFDVS